MANVRKLALVAVFSALGIAISPFTWFVISDTKANPTQHMINAILGVLLGPSWAVLAAVLIGVIRNMLGTGTLYAFPGGIPGGLIVGLVYWVLKRLKVGAKTRILSALTEPIGTLLIGVPLALFLMAPLIGTQSFLDLVSEEGMFFAFLSLGAGWALSCVPGSIIGFTVVAVLRKMGISSEALFGKE